MGLVAGALNLHQLRPDGVGGQFERMLRLLWRGDYHTIREMAGTDMLRSMRGPVESARGGTEESS